MLNEIVGKLPVYLLIFAACLFAGWYLMGWCDGDE